MAKDVVLVAVELQGEDSYNRRASVDAFSKWVQTYHSDGASEKGGPKSQEPLRDKFRFLRAGVMSASIVLENSTPGSATHSLVPGNLYTPHFFCVFCKITFLLCRRAVGFTSQSGPAKVKLSSLFIA